MGKPKSSVSEEVPLPSESVKLSQQAPQPFRVDDTDMILPRSSRNPSEPVKGHLDWYFFPLSFKWPLSIGIS